MKSGEEIPKDLPKVANRTLVIIVVCVAAIMVALFIMGFWVRHERISKREKMSEQIRDRKLVVQVVQPKATQQSFDLTLPAEVRAYATTALYARTNGFLASWAVDIGDPVKKGEVMAVISAPDTDADLEQAKANLSQQQTNYQLTINTDDRERGLIPIQGVTQQQLDQFHSSREQAKANVGAMSASVDRLQALVGFEKIAAPFDGVVTARNYDIGALIQAANNGPGQEMFDVADDDKLRVFANVPQAYASLVKVGQSVSLVLERNYPGMKFTGVVARSAGTIDPVTRTLRTEMDFRNDDPAHHIYPGTFGEVVLSIQRDQPILTVPTSALLFEAEGKQVAIVTSESKIHLQNIELGRDFGTTIEVTSGLKGDDRIVANPGEQMAEGVTVAAEAPKNEGRQPGKDAKSGENGETTKDDH
jgi:membrane fusion protein (multidrug efflux system)